MNKLYAVFSLLIFTAPSIQAMTFVNNSDENTEFQVSLSSLRSGYVEYVNVEPKGWYRNSYSAEQSLNRYPNFEVYANGKKCSSWVRGEADNYSVVYNMDGDCTISYGDPKTGIFRCPSVVAARGMNNITFSKGWRIFPKDSNPSSVTKFTGIRFEELTRSTLSINCIYENHIGNRWEFQHNFTGKINSDIEANKQENNYFITTDDPRRIDFEKETRNIFAPEKPVAGKSYYIKTPNNTFLSFDPNDKKFVSGNFKNKSKFKVSYRDDGKIFLQLADQGYLSASNDNTVTVRPYPYGWEAFSLDKAPAGRYYLHSIHNNYLHFDPNNNTLDLSRGKDKSTFKFIEAEDKPENEHEYYLRGPDDTFISFDSDTKKFILSTSDKKSKFKVIYKEDGKLFLQLANKEYLSASDDNTVTVRPNPWGWEAFSLEDSLGDSYYLVSFHNNYLHANINNNILDLSPTKDTAFKFIKISK